jgi:hypothetical protein
MAAELFAGGSETWLHLLKDLGRVTLDLPCERIVKAGRATMNGISVRYYTPSIVIHPINALAPHSTVPIYSIAIENFRILFCLLPSWHCALFCLLLGKAKCDFLAKQGAIVKGAEGVLNRIAGAERGCRWWFFHRDGAFPSGRCAPDNRSRPGGLWRKRCSSGSNRPIQGWQLPFDEQTKSPNRPGAVRPRRQEAIDMCTCWFTGGNWHGTLER